MSRPVDPAIELAHALLEGAGLPRNYAGLLLDRAESVEDVLRALRGTVRVVQRNERAHAAEELRMLARDLLRERYPAQDTRPAAFAAARSGTAEIVAGLRRLLSESAENPDDLFPRRLPLPERGARVLYPVEDGPGSSDVVRLEVLAMRGTKRSTIAVIDDVTGSPLCYDTVHHDDEAAAAGRGVETAILSRRATPQR